MSLLAWMPGPVEWAIIGVVALLLFGRRLPDVARSMGKSIVEFKRGLNDVKGEIDKASTDELPGPNASTPTSTPDKTGTENNG